MAEQIMSPDMKFIREVLASGGGDLMKCYQCGTCCAVCNPTPDKTPFPRKEMLYAQWGMKYKLIKDPDIWLCHQCSDCTKHCPRAAKPGEVLGALRKIAIAEHSFPGFLGKAVGDARYLILLFAVPVVIFLSILASICLRKVLASTLCRYSLYSSSCLGSSLLCCWCLQILGYPYGRDR
jgi:quinone-modifying oxidoreductase subunit QmoC